MSKKRYKLSEQARRELLELLKVTWANANWPGGTAPTLTTTANKWDYLTFVYYGGQSTYDGLAIPQNF